MARHIRITGPGSRRRIAVALSVAVMAGAGLLAGLQLLADPAATPAREADRAGFSDGGPGDATSSAGATTSPPASSVASTPSTPSPSRANPDATVTGKVVPTPKANPPAGQRTISAFISGYSYFDNTPAGSVEISHPIVHDYAGGAGTYADPITVAVGHSLINGRDVLDWPAGTRFYIPNLRRYFIAEDTCGDGSSPQNGPCHTGFSSPATTWLDIWIGGKGGSVSGSNACMDAITDVWQVVVNPGATFATVAGSVYGPAGCTRQYGNSILLS